MQMGKWRLLAWTLVFAGLPLAALGVVNHLQPSSSEPALSKNLLSEFLSENEAEMEFPTEIDRVVGGVLTRAHVQYSFNASLQSHLEHLFRSYRPDYGAFVALDPLTGRVLSLVSYVKPGKRLRGNLALRSTFPAASIFKVVTAAAAIAERNFSAQTVIPFSGRNHTLYRSNVLKTSSNRWLRHMTLKDAFAKSVNTVFGKIGVFEVGSDQLQVYADRFGFNRKIASDIPYQEGKAIIPQDPWELAESASGYTRETTMSPLQGALIAGAVLNDGMMMGPYVVESVTSSEGDSLYQAQPAVVSLSVDGKTAAEIRSLMRGTIQRGTSRKAFRQFFRGAIADLDVGGKTGSLTGFEPRGKYDWFIGFASDGRRPIAVSVLTVHEKYWNVKSSTLARKSFEHYYTKLK